MKKLLLCFILSGCATSHEWEGKRMISYCFAGVSYMEEGKSTRDAGISETGQMHEGLAGALSQRVSEPVSTCK
jgi:hypothetical protein